MMASEPRRDDDERWMTLALALAARALGMTAPNPAVGCVIVKDGRVVGRGATARGGRPHAETSALAQAGEAARGGTAYVTLEPCAHHGKTPPCTDALIGAGITRVIVAVEDPDPRVAGRGIAQLEAAGVTVALGCCGPRARHLNAGFFLKVESGRPLVTLKIATSLDGRIATHAGASRWITSSAARAQVHLMRAGHDAIMVGSNTVLHDDPDLTCRLPGLEDRSPVRVIADGRLRVPLTARIVRDAAKAATWIVTRTDADDARRRTLEACGAQLIAVAPGEEGSVDMGVALRALGERGITRLLVEGGAQVAAALLRAGLVDRLAWFRGNVLIGGDGTPALSALGIDRLEQAVRWSHAAHAQFGDDVLDIYDAGPYN